MSVVNKMAKVPVIDIRPADLETVCEVLRRHVPGHEVLAFGSRVQWTARDYSDLDLAIRSDEPIPSKIISAIKEELSESNLPMRVDVLDMASVDEKFRRIIEEEYAVVQRATKLAGWKTTTIGEFCPFSYGKGLAKKARNENGTIAVYGSNGKVGMHDSALIKGAGIMIGRKGTVGAVHYSSVPFWPIDTTFYVSNNSKSRDLRFTYYLLKSIGLETMNSDSAVPGLNRDAAHARKIFVPELSEQHKIARILGTLDDKIELNRRINKTLEAMAQAIFKSWFVDFDPAHAKAEGRDTGLPPEVADLFPDEFENSELGKIPQGWRVKSLGEVAEIIGGGTPSTKDEKNFGGEIPWITPKDLSSYTARYISKGKRNITAKGFAESSARMLPENSVVLSTRAPVGYLAIAKNPLTTNQGFRSLVVKDGFDPVFIYYLLSSNVKHLKSHASGSTFGELKGTTLKSLRFVFPPYAGQIAITRILGMLDDNIEQMNDTLAGLRDALLPKLIRGELCFGEFKSST